FNPEASVALWQNMGALSDGQPPEFMSTHPSHASRIKDLQRQMVTATPLYEKAKANGIRPSCKR
ncbi:MAG: putative Zn-dependent protease, partial [Zhongshania sp.]